MKYMGSKRYMLQNGLGQLIRKNVNNYERFVDLFSGAGHVSYFVAEQFDVPVFASDLQKYSSVLVGAVIEKTQRIDVAKLEKSWIEAAKSDFESSKAYKQAKRVAEKYGETEEAVEKSRKLCEKNISVGPIWSAYGGHYYSPIQALKIDYLLKHLPVGGSDRTNALAALVDAGSHCAAAPGHTAQPFQPTPTAMKFIFQYWKVDPFEKARAALSEFSQRYARVAGATLVADAANVVSCLTPGDLVFIDPPYSGVQYSRFYHVLETIARGSCGPVSGVGRYPDQSERPKSAYSNSGEVKEELENLMKKIAEKGSSVIFTFPLKKCSNGLSGVTVRKVAAKYFEIKEEKIHGEFSTLGGNNKDGNRPHKQKSKELLLYLKPKSQLEAAKSDKNEKQTSASLPKTVVEHSRLPQTRRRLRSLPTLLPA